ncbi:MAG: hypothetical protein OXF05_05020 [Hyphomicrobiales bacterium]|nr:hypothetical protein [Hyphomicrobiales bacterium]MCY4033319.1 hypothetical protein [Hyphomicrobiales bacterium]MCY4038510.1 hypothetical protein [Hyphomicrobiales bacterium]
MKTMRTALFALALMVFAFNVNPATANDAKEDFDNAGDFIKAMDIFLKLAENNPGELDAEIEGADRGDKEEAVAYFGANFCLSYPDAEICNNDWWSSEENEGELASLSDDELNQQIAGVINYCKKHGNCMMQIDDAESLDGFGGRNVADSGEEGSSSAAGADDQQ